MAMQLEILERRNDGTIVVRGCRCSALCQDVSVCRRELYSACPLGHPFGPFSKSSIKEDGHGHAAV